MILPREHETPFNKAPLIRAVAALLMVIAILSAVTRLVTRLLTVRALKADDALIAAATLFDVAQSIAVVAQGAGGLGKMHGLSDGQVSSILKGQYAGNVLFIISLLLSKMSATRTIWAMAPRERRHLILATEVTIGLWAMTSIGALFFQCSIPSPWDYIKGRCFNLSAFWIYVDALNIITDIAITATLFEMFMKLKTSTGKKAMVISVFSCRILIIPSIVCHMYYNSLTIGSNNPIFEMWKPTITIQVTQCLSILATCIPYLKPFLDSLESGQMELGDRRGTRSGGSSSRSKTGYGYGSTQTGTRTRNNTSKGITSFVTMASNASHRLQKYEMMDMGKAPPHGASKSPAAMVTTAFEGNVSWDGQSQTSQTVLVQQSWHVEVESTQPNTTR